MKHISTWLFIGGTIGLIGFLFLPNYLRLYTFFFPLIILCLIYTNSNSSFKFNYRFFFLISFVILMLPSNLFTLDAVRSYNSDNGVFDLSEYKEFGSNAVSFACIVLFGMPILLLGASIYAILVTGNVKEGISGIMKLVAIIFFVSTAVWLLKVGGVLPNIGLLTEVNTFYDGILKSIEWVIELSSTVIDKTMGLESLPFIGDTDSSKGTNQLLEFNSGSQPLHFIFTVHLAAQFAISAMCYVCLLHSLIVRHRGKKFKDTIDAITSVIGVSRKEKRYFKFRRDINIGMVIIVSVIIMIGLGMYISQSNPGITDSAIYGLYFGIDILCLIFLSSNIVPYKQGNKFDFIEGVIYGTLGIFVFYQLIVPAPLDVLLSMNDTNVSSNLLIQWILVAPTESLFFHIFLPGLVLLYLLIKHQKDTFKTEDGVVFYKRDLRELKGTVYLNALREKSKPKRDEYYTTMKEIDFYLEKRSEIDLNDLIYSNPRYIFYFILSLVIPNIVFALYHNLHSQMSFLEFFSSGAGLVYLFAGVWIAAIAWFFDWRAAIVSHAITNSLIITLSIIAMGV